MKKDHILREIPRCPKCPRLTLRRKREITKLVFTKSNPQPADVLFIFGSDCNDDWQSVAKLFGNGSAPVIYIAGGTPNRFGIPICEAIRMCLEGYGVPPGSIHTDPRATNTLEDAAFGQEFFKKIGISHKRILFVCKAPHSGRCEMTLRKVFPQSELFPFHYSFSFMGLNLTAKNWHRTKLGRSVVWGEFQRILLYLVRGDIARQ